MKRMNSTDIVEKARRVLDLQTKFVNRRDSISSLSTDEATALKEWVDLTDRILKDLVGAHHVVTDDPEVRSLIAQLKNHRDEEVETMGDAIDEDLQDAYRDNFWMAEYTARMLKLPVTFTRNPIPATLAELMEEARRCYASHHLAATIALCRTILEKTVTDIAIERGLIRHPTDDYFFRNYPPWKRFNMVLGEYTEARKEADNFYCYASRVIHGAEDPDENDAGRALESTFRLVTEMLDERH